MAVSSTASSRSPPSTASTILAADTPPVAGISRSSPAATAATGSSTAPQSDTTRPSNPHSSRSTSVSSQRSWEAYTPLIRL